MATIDEVENANRWTEAVLKLIKLTQEGRLEWSRENNNVFNPAFTTRYSANLQSQKFVLTVDISSRALGMMSDRAVQNLGMRGTFDRVSLEVFDASGNIAVTFPNVPALEGLGAVIYGQASGKVEEVLRVIAEAS